jgi:hypothetical protein
MIENLDFLPTWIKGSAIPASFVMGFFWKGDEALSEDFRKWLSQKILGLKLTVPDTRASSHWAKYSILSMGHGTSH